MREQSLKPLRHPWRAAHLLPLISFLLLLFSGAIHAQQGSSLRYIEAADGSRSSDNFAVIRHTHARLVFDKDIARIAIGNPDIIEMEVLAGREILMIAKNIGKTSVIVWYTDGTAEPLMFDVIEDLTVLRGVLSHIHPSIRIEMAPDRAALILRGHVPSIRMKLDAEAAARSYLSADGSSSFEIFTPSPAPGDTALATPRIAIINLLQTDEIAQSAEQKILQAVAEMGSNLDISRITRGQVADDAIDTFVLQGEVANQVTLTRVLRIAAGTLGYDNSAINAVSDEGGGLGGSASVGGNIGRARMLSTADGRIMSMIRVRNIPQVRVAVKIHEVNRSRLRDWNPDFSAVSRNYLSRSAQATRGTLAPEAFSVSGTDLANALQVINGTLTNNIQLATRDMAFDVLFSILEEEGISRVLSNPTLTVLSGEPAVFEVGGQIPVPSSFIPAGSGVVDDDRPQPVQQGIFSNVEFRRYGVTLRTLAMVDENNLITLDINPEISQPDIALTRQIAQATGSRGQTTAFNSRTLETRAQVRDGQPMVIGGLITRSSTSTEGYPTGVGNLPLFGGLTRSSSRAEVTTELVIIVTPTIVQQPLRDNGLWQYPEPMTLLELAVGIPDPSTLSPALRSEALRD